MSGKLYHIFVSDVHLGLKVKDPKERERRFVGFLNSLPVETKALYLVGDIFDFWYEYKYVVPKGHVRVLGALASLRDRGVELYFLKGNHDLWTFGYLEKELGLKVLEQPYVVEIDGATFCIGHGDGLGKGDKMYKFLRRMFHSRFLQKLFSNIHPRWAFGLANRWSKSSRLGHENSSYVFQGENSPIYKFADDFGKTHKIDYYIFGHYHHACNYDIPSGGKMYILGEWIHGSDFLYYDGSSLLIGSGYFPNIA